MKKWIIILAITNAVTLIALSISLTVIVMKDYLKGYDNAEKSDSQKMADEGNELKNNYESTKNQEKHNDSKTNNSNITNNDKDNTDKTSESVDEEPKKFITKEMYENTDFQDRWRVENIYIVSNNPENSLATLVNMLKNSHIVEVGTNLEKNKVLRITLDSVLFEDSYGNQFELCVNESPEWANQDNTVENDNKTQNYQDPDTGNITPNATELTDKTKKTRKTETIIGEDGNVIVVPEGVDKETLLKQLKSKRNAKAAEKAKAVASIPSELHSLTPQIAYKIKQNYVEYINAAVLENYYDAEKKQFAGILIVKFIEDSMYKKLGFKHNDIVTHINDNKVETTFDLDNVIKTVDFTKGAQIQILRDDKPMKLIYDFSMEDLLDLEQKMLEAMNENMPNDDKSTDK
ncbi:MAG: PDZ domain-containing protein [Planctomycetes bacterium]|nr:PDZ domain-containing protein [Planctomycetota bacterium]